jgi:hypothetical protein
MILSNHRDGHLNYNVSEKFIKWTCWTATHFAHHELPAHLPRSLGIYFCDMFSIHQVSERWEYVTSRVYPFFLRIPAPQPFTTLMNLNNQSFPLTCMIKRSSKPLHHPARISLPYFLFYRVSEPRRWV